MQYDCNREGSRAIAVDAEDANADGPKVTFDLPDYGSEAFMALLRDSGLSLEKFKMLPVYRYAVTNGLIDAATDEWRGPQTDVTAGSE